MIVGLPDFSGASWCARVVLGEELYGGDDNGVLGGLVGEETSKLLDLLREVFLVLEGTAQVY